MNGNPPVETAPVVPPAPPLEHPPIAQEETDDTIAKVRDTAVALALSHKLLKTQSVAPIAKRLIGTALRYSHEDEIPEPIQKAESPFLTQLDQHIDTAAQKIPEVIPTPKEEGVKISMDITEEKARKAIEDPKCFATFLLHSVKIVLGPEFPAWEPGTLWISLKKEDIDIPDCNKDKLLASICVIQPNPQFFWDASVFENTCLAFNNQEIFAHHWENQFLGFLCWGITEVDGFQPDTLEFDYDVVNYIAATAHHQGMLLLPEKLDFAQDRLNDLNRNSHLVPELKAAYKSIKDVSVDKYFSEEREVLDNLSMLKLVDGYLEYKMSKFKQQMKIYMK